MDRSKKKSELSELQRERETLNAERRAMKRERKKMRAESISLQEWKERLMASGDNLNALRKVPMLKRSLSTEKRQKLQKERAQELESTIVKLQNQKTNLKNSLESARQQIKELTQLTQANAHANAIEKEKTEKLEKTLNVERERSKNERLEFERKNDKMQKELEQRDSGSTVLSDELSQVSEQLNILRIENRELRHTLKHQNETGLLSRPHLEGRFQNLLSECLKSQNKEESAEEVMLIFVGWRSKLKDLRGRIPKSFVPPQDVVRVWIRPCSPHSKHVSS